MRSYEVNILNVKLLQTARRIDPATLASISVLLKDGREYLHSKKIEVTEKESLMLLITLLAYNKEPSIPAIIRRHIVSCKAFYEELNRQAKEKEEAAAPVEEEPTEPEPAADITAAEPMEPEEPITAEPEPVEPAEEEKTGGDCSGILEAPGC